MFDWTSTTLANRFLEPLVHPWSIVPTAVLGGDGGGLDLLTQGLRVVWRLAGVLLSL
jgi:hypothetical protein